MKPIFTFLFAGTVSLASVLYISFSDKNDKNKLKVIKSGMGGGAMEDDAQARMEWELKRLADPVTGRIPEYMRQRELAYAATLPNDAQAERSANFVSRGPWDVGGRTRAFALDVTNENRLLAGSPSGGMWLSTDGGNSWTATNTLSQLKGTTCLAQDKRPGHTNVWYYGSGEAYGGSAGASGAYYMGDGLFKSTDGGLSWQPIVSTAGGNPNSLTGGFQLVWNVAVDQSANDSTDEIYAATYGIGGLIWRSDDGGDSWTAVRGGDSYFTDVAVTTTGVVYATLSDDGTQKGIWRSPNGTNFTRITPSGFSPVYNRIVIGINPSNENEVYFLANTPGHGKQTLFYDGKGEWNSLWKYTYISGNGDSSGGSWQDLSMNLPNPGGQFGNWIVQGSYDMVVKVKPNDPNTIFIGGTNLYRSTSGFQDSTHTTHIGGYAPFTSTPNVKSYLNHHSDQHVIDFLPSNPDIMFSANDGGIFKTQNCMDSTVVWQPLNNGYLTTQFYTITIDHGSPGSDIICAGSQDNGTRYTNNTNLTTPWYHAHGGDGAYCAIADNSNTYYFSIQNLTRLVKANVNANGQTLSFARIDPIGGKDYLWMNPFVLDPNNNNIMYLAGGKYLWRNNDLSAIPLINNWDSISTNWTRFADSVPTANSVITALAVCKTPANRVYYGTDNKKIYKVDNANTGAPTPVNITPTAGVPFPPGYISCIAVDPTDGNKLVVVFSNYNVYSIFYSTDGGTTWAKAAGNLESSGLDSGPSVRWVSILPVADGKVYLAATSTGLYATDSLKGASTVWVQQGTNTIGNVVCDMIDTRISDGLVVVATHGTGIYSTHITSVNDIVSVNDIMEAKMDFGLRNYPNPVNESTTIEFTMNKKSNVTLQILDEYGRLIEELVNRTMQEGEHRVTYNRNNLKPGVYYYTLVAGNRRKTNKMVILK